MSNMNRENTVIIIMVTMIFMIKIIILIIINFVCIFLLSPAANFKANKSKINRTKHAHKQETKQRAIYII
jgi:hypothetical protein